jgi:hypothetical protein
VDRVQILTFAQSLRVLLLEPTGRGKQYQAALMRLDTCLEHTKKITFEKIEAEADDPDRRLIAPGLLEKHGSESPGYGTHSEGAGRRHVDDVYGLKTLQLSQHGKHRPFP